MYVAQLFIGPLVCQLFDDNIDFFLTIKIADKEHKDYIHVQYHHGTDQTGRYPDTT